MNVEDSIQFLTQRSTDPVRLQRLIEEQRLEDEQSANEMDRALCLMHQIISGNNSTDLESVGPIQNLGIATKLEEILASQNISRRISDSDDLMMDKIRAGLDGVTHRLGASSGYSEKFPDDVLADAINMEDMKCDLSSGFEILPFTNCFEMRAGKFSTALQELFLIDDLLSLLLGQPGRLIYPQNTDGGIHQLVFCVDETLSKPLLVAASDLLISSVDYRYLEYFTRLPLTPERDGRVCQALASAIGSLLSEFRQLIVALESKFSGEKGAMGLQQLSFHLQPYQRNLSVLANIVKSIQGHDGSISSSVNPAEDSGPKRGGAILCHLETECIKAAGDAILQTLIEGLLVEAARPWLHILGEWLATGKADDKGGEFCVRPRSHLDPPLYGTEAHTLTSAFVAVKQNTPSVISDCLPRLLQVGAFYGVLGHFTSFSLPNDSKNSEHANCDGMMVDEVFQPAHQKTITEGHGSLRVVNNLDSKEELATSGKINLNFDRIVLTRAVDQVYYSLNQRMLAALSKGDRLLRALHLCKSLYFVEGADFLHTFLDTTRHELDRPGPAVAIEHVKSGWEAAKIRCNVDDRMECYLADLTLSDQLGRIITASGDDINKHPRFVPSEFPVSGLDLLSMRVDLQFPETLLFTPDNVAKYELIFRLILRLVDLARSLSSMRATSNNMGRAVDSRVGLLRKQMLHLIQGLHQYLVNDVFEPNWAQLVTSISTAAGMDAIMQLHAAFIDSCLRQAMLTNAKLVELFSALFDVCSRFVQASNILKSTSRGSIIEQDEIARFESIRISFDKAMRQFIDALQHCSSRDYDYHLGSLLARLDHNLFYFSTANMSNVYSGPTVSLMVSTIRSGAGGGGGLVG